MFNSNEIKTNKNTSVNIIFFPFFSIENKIFFLFSSKPITVTAERLSDHSRITFTISSDKTIENLRSLLNHHLPPHSPNHFYLYSYQRGALIHYHPPSFKLDYFPVIFDQSVLLLKMDDRNNNNTHVNNEKHLYQDSKKSKKVSLLKNLLSSSTTRSNKLKKTSQSSSSSKVTCLSIFKEIFYPSSKLTMQNVDNRTSILTY